MTDAEKKEMEEFGLLAFLAHRATGNCGGIGFFGKAGEPTLTITVDPENPDGAPKVEWKETR
jgi:hypothetical protein